MAYSIWWTLTQKPSQVLVFFICETPMRISGKLFEVRNPHHSWRPTLVAQWACTSCSTAALIHAFFPGSSLPPRSEGTRWSGQLWRRGAAHMPARACWCPGLPHGCPPPMTSSIIVVGLSAAQIVDGVIQNCSPKIEIIHPKLKL